MSGRIPKRSNGADCKSAGYAFTGSNPVPPTIFPKENGSSRNRAYFAHKNAMAFPHVVTYRGLTAKVYGKDARGYYRVTWQDAGKQKQASDKKLSEAKRKAKDALRLIARGHTNQPSPREINNLRIAQSALNGYGIGLVDAINEFCQAKKLMPADELREAAKIWIDLHANTNRILFKTGAETYIRERKASPSVSAKLAHEDELRMNRFIEAFCVDVCDVSKAAIAAFFEDLEDLAPRTRNHFRQTLRHFLKWCVKKDFLAKGHSLSDELENESVVAAEPEIITPAQYRTLLESCSPDMLPHIAIAGFAGVRRAEILRLTWKDVWKTKGDTDSPDGYIEIPARKAKGGRDRRLVPIQPALAEWLTPYRQATGTVWSGTENQFHHAFEKLMTVTNSLSGQNLLRHSYVSYRMAQTQNENTVSVESGHAPAVLFRNYRKLVSPAQAKRWFSITPSTHR